MFEDYYKALGETRPLPDDIHLLRKARYGANTGVNPKNETASQGTKYIEWREEWICPELFTVAI